MTPNPKHARKGEDMRRGNNIFLATEGSTGIPVAAFTDKYEMQVWLYQQRSLQSLVHLRLWELRDSAYWHGKTPDPFPLDVLYNYREGEKIIAQRTVQNKTWE